MRVLRENRIEPVTMEDYRELRGARLVDVFIELLRSSDLLVADVSRKNPNVLFELGIAHGLGKPFILLLDEKDDSAGIPSDLTGYQYVPYDPADLSRMVNRLVRLVRQFLSAAEQRP
jgi:hypothetical protein